jgi:uncharacterized protein YciI
MKKLISTILIVLGLGMSFPAGGDAPDIRYVVIHKAGKAWDPKLSMFEQAYILKNPNSGQENQTHVNHYKKLLELHKLEMGGPLLDSKGALGDPVGMMVPISGITVEEITRFAAEDPAVQAEVLDFEVRQWLIGMKK